jgi:hypothetical protein
MDAGKFISVIEKVTGYWKRNFCQSVEKGLIQCSLERIMSVLSKRKYKKLIFFNFRCNYMNRGNVNNAAVDAIDQCCLEHYSCYRQLSMSTECVPVSVTAYDTILRKGTVTCMDTVNSCAYSVCACDKQMADCFKTQNQAYNASKFKNVTKEECKRKYRLIPFNTFCTRVLSEEPPQKYTKGKSNNHEEQQFSLI